MTRTVREEMEQVAKNHRLRAAERALSPFNLLVEIGRVVAALVPLGIAVATGHLNPIIVGLMVGAFLIFLAISELRRFIRRRRYVRLRHKGQEHILRVPKGDEHVEYLLPSGDRVVLRNPHDYERKED